MQTKTEKTRYIGMNTIAMLAAGTSFGSVLISGSGLASKMNTLMKLLVLMYSCLWRAEPSSYASYVLDPLLLIAIAVLGIFSGLFTTCGHRLMSRLCPEQAAT